MWGTRAVQKSSRCILSQSCCGGHRKITVGSKTEQRSRMKEGHSQAPGETPGSWKTPNQGMSPAALRTEISGLRKAGSCLSTLSPRLTPTPQLVHRAANQTAVLPWKLRLPISKSGPPCSSLCSVAMVTIRGA